MDMTVKDLIEALGHADPDAEIRIAYRPVGVNCEGTLENFTVLSVGGGEVVYLTVGDYLGLLHNEVAKRVGLEV